MRFIDDSLTIHLVCRSLIGLLMFGYICQATTMTILYFAVLLSVLTLVSGCQEKTDFILPDGQVGQRHLKKIQQPENNTNEYLKFTIRVKYPESVLKIHERESLFIRGNGLGLLWTKGYQLTKTGYDTWDVNITYTSSLDGYQCKFCLNKDYLHDKKLQYRIMADDLQDMIGANFAIHFPVSEVSSYFETVPVFSVYPWFFTYTGVIDSFVMNSTILGEEKNITLYTPPSFNENVYKTYPTIFVFDLNLEYAKSFKKKFEDPIYPHAVAEEFVLIGFGDYTFDGRERVNLLTPTAGPVLDCINGTLSNNCDGCIPVSLSTNVTAFIKYLKEKCGKYYIKGGQGDKTLDFLEKEAFPSANQITSMRLQQDNIGVMGYSLGGLMSCYAVWTRPDVYSFAACQSPSLWWPFNSLSHNVTDFDFLNKTLKNPIFQTKRPEQKIYLDAGGAETSDPYRLTQSTVEAAHAISSFEHYEINRNVWVAVDPNKNHSPAEWESRIGQALTTLLPAHGSKGMPSLDVSPLGYHDKLHLS